MQDHARLEFSVSRKKNDDYDVKLSFHQPGDQTDFRLGGSHEDPSALIIQLPATLFTEEHLLDLDLYGSTLSDAFFAREELRLAFARICSVAESHKFPLNIRLWLGADAAHLHDFAWETLLHPETRALLCTSENWLFSRYVSSETLQKTELHAPDALTALVAVASPKDLPAKMPEVKEDEEIATARQGFGPVPLTILPDKTSGERATLPNILNRLRDGVDILYLVCHGTMGENDGWLWLEDQNQQVAKHSATEITSRISELQNPPSLVVLVSCQSAGSLSENPGGQALRSIGPKLVKAGIPAVVAMQSRLRMDTAAQFMPMFLRELRRDGKIDRALAVARSRVLKQFDWWVPVLFSSLNDNQLFVPLVNQASGGIQALGKLIEQSSELRTFVSAFRADFDTALQQADRMASYKDLHDLLHRLHFEFYEAVKNSPNDFPNNEAVIDLLDLHLQQLDKIRTKLNEVVGRPTIKPTEKLWTQKIDTAYRDIKQALDDGNQDLLKRALSSLKSVIANQPTRINGALTEAARSLQMKALIRELENISAKVQNMELAQAYLNEYGKGLQALTSVDERLNAQIEDHDLWQAMENEVRPLEQYLDTSQLDEFKHSWPDVRQIGLSIFGENPMEWALKLCESSSSLDRTIGEDNPVRIRRAFRDYRSRIGNRFFQVDTDLKKQCGEIRTIGEPLNAIMRMIE